MVGTVSYILEMGTRVTWLIEMKYAKFHLKRILISGLSRT